MIAARTAAGWVAVALLSAGFFQPVYAYDIPPNDGLVTVATQPDVAVITREQRNQIAAQLEAYEQATSNQIAIVIIQSLHGEPIEDVGIQIARKWGVGSSKNNGILILFSYDDRQVRMDVGYGLEGAVPDIVAGGIINEDMIPHFRNGDYFGGFNAAIDALEKHIGGEYTADRYAQSKSGVFSGAPLIFLLILFQWIVVILARTKSWWLGGIFGVVGGIVLVVLYGWWLSIPALSVLGFFLDFFVSRNFHQRGKTKWWAGGGWGPGGRSGGGFGGSGGGFGGFGGGGFGGGGASGRW